VNVAGAWCSVYRAIDEPGQIGDIYGSEQRATGDVAGAGRLVRLGSLLALVCSDCREARRRE
jgi:hypothetical protein